MNRDHVIVHHTGAEEKDAAQVKRYHLSLGWQDVGYNYLVERDGTVVNGRPLDLPGAHCRAGGMNRRGIGVSLIGNLDNHPPTTRQVDVLLVLLRDLMALYGIPAQRVLGHREVPGAATACPGRYMDMHALRRKLTVAQGTFETGSLVIREERAVPAANIQAIEDTVIPVIPGDSDSLYVHSVPSPGYTDKIFSSTLQTSGAAGTVPEPIGPVVWRVLSGLFSTQKEAEQRARQLHQKGFEAIVVPPD